MRKYIYLLCIFALFCACEDNDDVFPVGFSQENIREIRPIPGGAVMYYNLPSDLDLMAIRVRYKDAFGQEIMRSMLRNGGVVAACKLSGREFKFSHFTWFQRGT